MGTKGNKKRPYLRGNASKNIISGQTAIKLIFIGETLMNKQTLFKYGALFLIIAFFAEIILSVASSAQKSNYTPTPTATATPKTLTGQGVALSRIVGAGNQFLAECNATDAGVARKIGAISGVQAAALEQTGVFYEVSAQAGNETENITKAAMKILEQDCDGFFLYKNAYVLPQENLAVSFGNYTANYSNYTMLSLAQSLSAKGITALVDARLKEGDETAMQYTIQTLSGVPRKATAIEASAYPQAQFTGTARISAQISALSGRMLIKCTTNNTNESAEVLAAIKATNMTANAMLADEAAGLFVIDLQNASQVAIFAAQIAPALGKCNEKDLTLVASITPLGGTGCNGTASAELASFVEAGANGTCREYAFSKMLYYAQERGNAGIPAAVRPDATANQSISADLNIATQNGRISALIALQG